MKHKYARRWALPALALAIGGGAHAQTFSWADGVPLYGSALSEIKVTDDDPDNEGGPIGTGPLATGRDCSPGTRTWPYSAFELTADLNSDGIPDLYQDADFTTGLWSLDSARDTVDVMVDTSQNLFIADVTGFALNGIGWEVPERECAWYSLAALDDHIESRTEIEESLYTGLYIGPDGHVPDTWACTFDEYVRRARLEAGEHPDVFKVVYLDELYRLMDGPEAVLYQKDGAHWQKLQVQTLRQKTRGGTIGPDPDRFGLASAWCPTTPAYLGGGSDVELWSRMVDVSVPRYVVPSSVLGVPADPVCYWGGSCSDTDYSFDGPSNDRAWVEWQLTAPSVSFSGHPFWSAQVEYLYTPSALHDQDLDLWTWMNGSSLIGGIQSLNGQDPELVQRQSIGIGGNVGPNYEWDATPGAVNTLNIDLRPGRVTDRDVDRLAWVWAVRVKYVDASTGNAFWTSDYLNPDSATYGAVRSSPMQHILATDNGEWRVGHWLDGVAVAHEIGAEEWDSLAFDLLMEHTCGWLHGLPEPRRCLVDERGAVFNSDYLSDLVTGRAHDRMKSAGRWGDGVVSSYLPIEMPLVGTDSGRFTPRDQPLDMALIYEPRLTHTWFGETHQWEAVVPSGCAGGYTVDWELTVNASEPDMGWYVKRKSAAYPEGYIHEEGRVGDATAQVTSGVATIPVVLVGDSIVVGWTGDWVGENGGSSTGDANYIRFTGNSPSGCGTPFNWVYSSGLDTAAYPEVEDIYSCITNYFIGSGAVPCGF